MRFWTQGELIRTYRLWRTLVTRTHTCALHGVNAMRICDGCAAVLCGVCQTPTHSCEEGDAK